MSKADRPKLLLIVTGSTLRAEEMDRPLAYYLKQQVEQSVADRPVDGMALHVLVVADFRWLHDEPLQRLPTISVGGPGVNALARQWFEEDLPNSLVVDGRYFVQMDPELAEPRAQRLGHGQRQHPVCRLGVPLPLPLPLPPAAAPTTTSRA
ncbi:MAG: hypothetical protein U0800_20295 [Isosphaeraceae bacterium]